MTAPRSQWNDRATLPQLDEVFRIMRVGSLVRLLLNGVP
jgi:hypothetical protein